MIHPRFVNFIDPFHSPPAVRNIKLLLEYDGTDYCGWQRQENGRTIQGEIESQLQRLIQEEVGVIGAGRTDAGVHARGQVANFHTNSPFTPDEFKHGLNALLPDDIVVHEALDVPLGFHSRYSAIERTYSYHICRTPAALLRNYCWLVEYDIRIDPMRWASAAILGEHDFGSFCKTKASVDHHLCTVSNANWILDGTDLTFTIRANRFLHGMVRALVGTIIDVGRGYTSLDEFLKILEAKDRSSAGMAAPAKGLCLESISY